MLNIKTNPEFRIEINYQGWDDQTEIYRVDIAMPLVKLFEIWVAKCTPVLGIGFNAASSWLPECAQWKINNC